MPEEENVNVEPQETKKRKLPIKSILIVAAIMVLEGGLFGVFMMLAGPKGADADTAGVREAEPGPLDLISLAGLVRWVAATLERVGRARTEVVLDAYEQSGRMSPEVKQVALTLCELADEDPNAAVPVRDIVGAMMRLEGILGNDDGESNRLLSLIFQDEYESADNLMARLGLT